MRTSFLRNFEDRLSFGGLLVVSTGRQEKFCGSLSKTDLLHLPKSRGTDIDHFEHFGPDGVSKSATRA